MQKWQHGELFPSSAGWSFTASEHGAMFQPARGRFEALKALGDEGWEVYAVAYGATPESPRFYLKRPEKI